MSEFFSFGEPAGPDQPTPEVVRRIHDAILRHRYFRFIEMRSLMGLQSIIVVDCFATGVPTRNEIGINNRERLALAYIPNSIVPHHVIALRRDFPITLHQNYVDEGNPPSLCIYMEPWGSLERTWTPEIHLETIIWWLESCASGTLHPPEQPLEQLYFEGPVTLVLPSLDAKTERTDLVFDLLDIKHLGQTRIILRGGFRPTTERAQKGRAGWDLLFLRVPPMVQSHIERYPSTLGALHDQFVKNGSSFLEPLSLEISSQAEKDGITQPSVDTKILLLLDVPMRRSELLEPEIHASIGFFAQTNICELGVACGALIDGRNGKYYKDRPIGGYRTRSEDWRETRIFPVHLEWLATRSFARAASGLEEKNGEDPMVLAGTGALGSAMADIWAKEAWGTWTYIDEDYIRPHNIVRHIARDCHIGLSKVDATVSITGASYPSQSIAKAIYAKANDNTDATLANALERAKLFVDATTTLAVPRDVSCIDSFPRSASVFATPSGMGSVMLLEDAERNVRLNSLEAQYYRALIKEDWGRRHLAGHRGEIWVGAGCRDVSFVLSMELIKLHASIISRQLRIAQAKCNADIRVWEAIDATGQVEAHVVGVSQAHNFAIGEWVVQWDEATVTKLGELRKAALPRETGGIVLGYIDQKTKRIAVVDALEAPPDSELKVNGFMRGKVGLEKELDRILDSTAKIVGYIGEWHSHPRQASTWPSYLDCALLQYLAIKLEAEGKPGLIMIAGDHALSAYIGELER